MTAREWLHRYGKHLWACSARVYPFDAKRCNCGLEEARRELR